MSRAGRRLGFRARSGSKASCGERPRHGRRELSALGGGTGAAAPVGSWSATSRASGRRPPRSASAPGASSACRPPGRRGRCLRARRGCEPVAQALVRRSLAYPGRRTPGPGRRLERDDRAACRAGGAVADRVLHPAAGLVARPGEPDPRVAAAGDHGHVGRPCQSHRHTSRRGACRLWRARSGTRGMPPQRSPFGMPRRSVSAIHVVTASAAAASPP